MLKTINRYLIQVFLTGSAIVLFSSISTAQKAADDVAQKSATVDSAIYQRLDDLEKQVSYHKSGDEHFMVVGLTTLGFASNKTNSIQNGVSQLSKTNSLGDADHYEFSPMLLWRHKDNFLMEFEPSFANNSLGVNWADVSYFVTPNLVVRGGYFVLPFGMYNKKLAAGWINKLSSDPIGIPSLTDYGFEVQGGLQAGSVKWNYDLSVTNGLQLMPDGQLQTVGISDNNNDKTITARIGFLPLSNSSLEIGVSTLTGKVGDEGSAFSNARANMYAVDFNYVNSFDPILVNVKGQYSEINVTNQSFINPTDTSTYSFDNRTKSFYAQLSLRPTGATNDILKNFEVAVRYANHTTPANSLWGAATNQWDIGLDYWFSWRSVLKLTYEDGKTTSASNGLAGFNAGTSSYSNWILQFSIQL